MLILRLVCVGICSSVFPSALMVLPLIAWGGGRGGSGVGVTEEVGG